MSSIDYKFVLLGNIQNPCHNRLIRMAATSHFMMNFDCSFFSLFTNTDYRKLLGLLYGIYNNNLANILYRMDIVLLNVLKQNSHWGKGSSRGNFQTLILRHSNKVQYLGICYTIA